MSMEWGIRIMMFGMLGVLVFAGIFLPLLTATQDIVPSAMGSMDCIAAYTKLMGGAASISPYIMTAPKGMRGELIAAQGNWYIGAKSVVCKTGIGLNFVQALAESNYLEKHANECIFSSACVSLNSCTNAGKAILVPGTDDVQKTAIMESVCLDCLQVANYLLLKNQYLSKQASAGYGQLTVGWTKFPP